MPKTVWGNWWNGLPLMKVKGKGGKYEFGAKCSGKGKSKGKGQYSPPQMNMMEEYYGGAYGCD